MAAVPHSIYSPIRLRLVVRHFGFLPRGLGALGGGNRPAPYADVGGRYGGLAVPHDASRSDRAATHADRRRHSNGRRWPGLWLRSEEHTSELQSRLHLVCRLLLEKKKKN